MADTTVTFLLAGDPEVGAWCPACALPSGFSVAFFLEADPPSQHYPQVQSFTRCVECCEPIP